MHGSQGKTLPGQNGQQRPPPWEVHEEKRLQMSTGVIHKVSLVTLAEAIPKPPQPTGTSPSPECRGHLPAHGGHAGTQSHVAFLH